MLLNSLIVFAGGAIAVVTIFVMISALINYEEF